MSLIRAATAFITVAAIATTAFANKAIRPTLQNTSGAWVGVEDDGRRLYRLVLRPNGTGTLAVAWLSSRRDVDLFTIDRVEFDGIELRMRGVSEASPPSALGLDGKAYPGVMLLDLKMSMPWKAAVSLYAESDWKEAIHAVHVGDEH
jgi:hypothetical protein